MEKEGKRKRKERGVEEKRKAKVRIDVRERAEGRRMVCLSERVQGPRLVLESVSRRLVLVLRSRWVTGLAGPVVATYVRTCTYRPGRCTLRCRVYTHVTRTRRTPTWSRGPERILQPERIIHPRYWSKYSVAFTYES